MNQRSSVLEQNGFSLLELVVVLTIISIVIGTSLMVGSKQVERERISTTFAELKLMQESLKTYAKVHGKLPCPAPAFINSADPLFGYAATDCDSTPSANVYHIASPDIKAGEVPFRTLNLPVAFAADQWDGRYLYSVSDNLIPSIEKDMEGVMTIVDTKNEIITQKAAYVILSLGKSGLGSFNHKNNAAGPACSTTHADSENCKTPWQTFMDGSIRETDGAANFFDDIMVWANAEAILAP